MRAKGIERFLGLPLYCDKVYNLSPEVGLVERVSWSYLRWA